MTLGRSGEDLAARYLNQKNYQIIERNFRSKLGEIDIIARQGKTLIFCEVKTRLNNAYGYPFEAVTMHKQNKIRKVAELYLIKARNETGNYDSIRFDVISVVSAGRSVNIEHIENAF